MRKRREQKSKGRRSGISRARGRFLQRKRCWLYLSWKAIRVVSIVLKSLLSPVCAWVNPACPSACGMCQVPMTAPIPAYPHCPACLLPVLGSERPPGSLCDCSPSPRQGSAPRNLRSFYLIPHFFPAFVEKKENPTHVSETLLEYHAGST